jgi:glutathione S-transferase
MLRAVATPPRSAGDKFMTLVYVVMMLAVIEYFAFGMAVGMARGRYKIPAPAVSGNPDFERYYRVQMNTLEQMMVFLPSLWTFAIFVSATWAAGLGAVFVLGRLLYFMGYAKAAEKRGPGFLIGAVPTMILLAGGLIGAVLAALRS